MAAGASALVQKYTLWINYVFERAWKEHRVVNLFGEISKGVVLINLTSTLLSIDLPILHPSPRSTEECQQNVELSLEVISSEGMDIYGVTSMDVACGNADAILSLCGFLQRYFSFGSLFNESRYIRTSPAAVTVDLTATPVLSSTLRVSKTFGDATARSSLKSRPVRFQRVDRVPRHSQGSSMFLDALQDAELIVYEKEDIGLFDWICEITGYRVLDYGDLQDGCILFELVRVLSPGSVSLELFNRLTTLQRLKLLFDAIRWDLRIESSLSPEDILYGSGLLAQRRLLQALRQMYLEKVAECQSDTECVSSGRGQTNFRRQHLHPPAKPLASSWVSEMQSLFPAMSVYPGEFAGSEDSSATGLNRKYAPAPDRTILSAGRVTPLLNSTCTVGTSCATRTTFAASSQAADLCLRVADLRSRATAMSGLASTSTMSATGAGEVQYNELDRKGGESSLMGAESTVKNVSHENKGKSLKSRAQAISCDGDGLSSMSSIPLGPSPSTPARYEPPRWSAILRAELQYRQRLQERGGTKGKSLQQLWNSVQLELSQSSASTSNESDPDFHVSSDSDSSICATPTETSLPTLDSEALVDRASRGLSSNNAGSSNESIHALSPSIKSEPCSKEKLSKRSGKIYRSISTDRDAIEGQACTSFPAQGSGSSRKRNPLEVAAPATTPAPWKHLTELARAQSRSPSALVVDYSLS